MPPTRPKRKGRVASPKSKPKPKAVRKAPRRSQRTRTSRAKKKLPVTPAVAFRSPTPVVIPVTYVKWLDLPGEGRRRYFLSEYTQVRSKRTYLLVEVAGRIVEVTDAFWKAQGRLVRLAKVVPLRLVRKDDAA